MQPSSLVFLVIIAVWAAYFVQYWVRRREHLATARSVDQFSESMRVLERRSPLPASNLSNPQPRSYAVTPARAARPQVLVKRAETAPAEPVAQADDESWVSRTSPAMARRNRAMIMLGALSTVVVTVPLVALSLLPALTLIVPLVSVGGAVVWSRTTARAARGSQAVARRSARPARRHTVADPSHATAVVDAAGPGVVEASVEVLTDPVAHEPTAPARMPRDELYDVQAVESGLRQPAPAAQTRPAAQPASAKAVPAAPQAGPLVDEDDIPLTWDPVPVPRPTYAMKSRVTRPAPTSADLIGDADTEYAAYDEVPERRVAGA